MLLTTSQLNTKKHPGDSISVRLRRKVYKPEPDALRFLCGDEVKEDEEGRQYFEIPSAFAEYVGKVFTRYEVGDEFLPENKDTLKAVPHRSVEITESNIENQPTDPLLCIAKKRGNPNWGKKKESGVVLDSSHPSEE